MPVSPIHLPFTRQRGGALAQGSPRRIAHCITLGVQLLHCLNGRGDPFECLLQLFSGLFRQRRRRLVAMQRSRLQGTLRLSQNFFSLADLAGAYVEGDAGHGFRRLCQHSTSPIQQDHILRNSLGALRHGLFECLKLGRNRRPQSLHLLSTLSSLLKGGRRGLPEGRIECGDHLTQLRHPRGYRWILYALILQRRPTRTHITHCGMCRLGSLLSRCALCADRF